MAWFPALHAVWMGSASSRAGSGLLKYTPSLMSRMAWVEAMDGAVLAGVGV